MKTIHSPKGVSLPMENMWLRHKADIARQYSRPCEAERVPTDSMDYIHSFFCASRDSFYKGFRHSVPLTSETIGATFFFFGEEKDSPSLPEAHDIFSVLL